MQSNLLAQLEKDRKRREELLQLRKSTQKLDQSVTSDDVMTASVLTAAQQQKSPNFQDQSLEQKLVGAKIDLAENLKSKNTVSQWQIPKNSYNSANPKEVSVFPNTPNFQNLQSQMKMQALDMRDSDSFGSSNNGSAKRSKSPKK